MNKVVEEYRIADENLKRFIISNKQYLDEYGSLIRGIKNSYDCVGIPSSTDWWYLDIEITDKSVLLTDFEDSEAIDIPLNFFDNPSQFVKDFEAKCIEEQKQKDIDVELKDKENRRKQFKKLQEEFKDEM